MIASKLYDAGYTDIHPVIPPGVDLSPNSKVHPRMRGKVPGRLGPYGWAGLPKWREYQATPKDIRKWARTGANVGLNAERFPGVDIDVDNKELSLRLLDVVTEVLGPAPTRLSRGARLLLVYRADEPFPKQKIHITFRGGEHVVEILGRGQQYLVHGKHPKGKKYRWWKVNLWDWPADKLTTITAADIDRLSEKIRGVVEAAGGSIETRKRDAEVEPQENLRAPSLRALRKAVERIPNGDAFADRENYIAMGAAIKAAGGDEAKPIFLEWAARWTGGDNDPDVVEADWDGLHPPFQLGWEWIRARARPDPTEEFGVDPAAEPPQELPDAIYLTEEYIAQRVLKKIRDRIRWVPFKTSGKWMHWNGTLWEDDDMMNTELAVRVQLGKQSRHLYNKLADLGTKERRAVMSIIRKIQSKAGVGNIMGLLRALRVVPRDAFDADSWVLNTPSSLIDLRTNEPIARVPESMVSKVTAVDAAPYYDPANAPKWEAFLDFVTKGDEELAAFLRRYAGYCLTGDNSEKKFLFMWGRSETGKSTFINTLSEIMGGIGPTSYAGYVAMNSLLDMGRGNIPDDIAQLPGKRLVTASEPKANAYWNDELIKAITGRDVLTVRKLYESNFQLKPQFKLLVGGNTEPKLGRLEDGMKTRLLIAPLDNVVPKEEMKSQYEIELVNEEGPHILAWMIRGCQEWQERGLDAPPAVQAKTEEYWDAEDRYGQWLEEECDLATGVSATLHELYRSWHVWAHARGVKANTEADLAQYLVAQNGSLGIDKGLVEGKIGFTGIRVPEDLDVLD